MDVQEFSTQLGIQLRKKRHLLGLSLKQVEEKSGGEFTIEVVGSWERAVRKIKIERLAALARFYNTDVAALLPAGRQAPSPAAVLGSWQPAIDAITETDPQRPAREIAADLGIEPFRAQAVDAYVTRRRSELSAAR